MRRMILRRVRAAVALAVAGMLVVAVAASAATGTRGHAVRGHAAADVTHSTGTLPDGATWIADVPSNWNGTLLLYSHGYGPLLVQDAPDPTTQQALLADGYALTGSSYDPNGSWWALGSAVRDQFETLKVVTHTELPGAPSRTYAFGTSMGGLISALEDQNSDGRLDGSLTTCGIVGGALNLNQYQLDGEYALSRLLAPGQDIQLTNFTVGPPTFADSAASAAKLLAAGAAAQQTAAGRARLALAMAFLNVSPWGDASPPSIYDYAGQEQGQYDDYFQGGPGSALSFIMTGRDQLEAAAGGESAGTVGVPFASILHHSAYFPEVRALYDAAGLSLSADLRDLVAHADLQPSAPARAWQRATGVPTGHLQVPELDLHTISDQLVPVQQEAYYRHVVGEAGSAGLLRQAFADAQGHCNFTSADLIAGVQALDARVTSGHWGSVATPGALDAAADALDPSLGGGNFIPFWPTELTGAVSRFGVSFPGD
jgi:hypothetical protein